MNWTITSMTDAQREENWRIRHGIDPDQSYQHDHDHSNALLAVYSVYEECDPTDPGARMGDEVELTCPICSGPVRGPAGIHIAKMRIIAVSTDDPVDEDEDEPDPQEQDRMARVLKMMLAKHKFPQIDAWFAAGNEPIEQEDAYGLEDIIGWHPERPAYKDNNQPPDPSMYCTRWEGDTQVIWQEDIFIENEAFKELRLTTEAERNALITMASAYKQEPDWDRSTYESFIDASTKDD